MRRISLDLMDLPKHEGALNPNRFLPSHGLDGARKESSLGIGRNLLVPRRRFDPDCPELIDRGGMDAALLREELQTLENCNRRLGGHDLVLQYVQRLVDSAKPASLSILDLGTGVADIPRAIAAWVRRRGLPTVITAVDRNPEIIQIARESCRDCPEIRFEQHDLRSLPYEPESFDLVLCSLVLHHFESAEAVAFLRRLHALSRCGYIVNDLRRNWPAIWSTELLTRTLIRSPVFRHDAVQSCRAAFTVRELSDMAERAGMKRFQIKRHHAVFRMVLEGRK
jgi:2-polyprenyl-3-methyl-5-hydroxy-6-metoxy-1,4-benzoquinol methylase